MPFARPTLAELIARVRGDIRGRLEVSTALVRRAMADVLAAVWAGSVHLLHGFIEWAVRQIFATTADREQLLEQALAFGFSPTPATFASGNVTATGTNGTAILVDTIIVLDAATRYRVTTGQVIAGGVATLPVTAVLAGEAANVPDGTALTFETPIAGVNSGAEADGDISGGVDEEGTEEFRARFLLHKRKPPEGGADRDYEAWTLAVGAAGLTRAWVFPHELGLGTVVVRFVLIDEDTGEIIFPDAGQVAAVQAALDAERPITAEVTAMAPDDLPVAFTIHISPDNADTRAAVLAELEDLFGREGEPGDGAGRGTILLSKIRTAIGIAEGVEDYVLTVPSADVVPGVGELPTVGVPTWV